MILPHKMGKQQNTLGEAKKGTKAMACGQDDEQIIICSARCFRVRCNSINGGGSREETNI